MLRTHKNPLVSSPQLQSLYKLHAINLMKHNPHCGSMPHSDIQIPETIHRLQSCNVPEMKNQSTQTDETDFVRFTHNLEVDETLEQLDEILKCEEQRSEEFSMVDSDELVSCSSDDQNRVMSDEGTIAPSMFQQLGNYLHNAINK